MYDKLKKLGISIPKVIPRFVFVPGVQVGNLLFISGQTPEINGEMQYVGILGENLDIEIGKKAARLAAINCLGEIELELGSLDNVERIVRMTGFIRSAKDFGQQPLVLNGASEFLIEIFGERGKHARSAIGVSELPFNSPIELEMIIQVK